MRSYYVEPRAMRHRVEVGTRGEQLRIPVRRNWLMLAFMLGGLALWILAGFMSIVLVARNFGVPDVEMMVIWPIGLVFALVGIAGQVAGAEIIRVVANDLEISIGVGPLRRTWRYRGGEISNLMGMEPDLDTDMWGIPVQRWLFARSKSGAVKFDYGSESIYFACAVDEPEGREIAAWLARRLPRGAVYGEG